MKNALAALGILVVITVAVILAIYGYGTTLPETHRVAKTVRLEATQDVVWALITDYQNTPEWWSDVKSVEEETRPDGTRVTWNIDQHGERLGFVTSEVTPPTKLVRKILDEGLPFGGVWIFELATDGGATQLTLTEDGFVTPPFFRAAMHLIIGEDAKINSFLTALVQKTTVL